MKLVKLIVLILGKVVVFVFLINIVALVGFIWVSSQKYNEEEDGEGIGVKKYKSVEYDPSDNTVSFGFASLNENVIAEDSDDFIHYVSEDDHHTIITNFGSKAYTCTGKCYCQSSRRRSTASTSVLTKPLRTGLITLLSAASTYTAYQLAKDIFRKDCEDYLVSVKMGGGYDIDEEELVDQEGDDPNFIFEPDGDITEQYFEHDEDMVCEDEFDRVMADVDKCLAIEDHDMVDSLDDADFHTQQEKIDSDLLFKDGHFWCSGHCVQNNDFLDRKEREVGEYWEGLSEEERTKIRMKGVERVAEECEKIELSTLIVIDEPEEKDPFGDEDPAKNFQRYHLAPLCFMGGKSVDVKDSKKLFDAVKNIYRGGDGVSDELKDQSDSMKGVEIYDGGFGKCIDSNPPSYHNPSIKCVEERRKTLMPEHGEEEEEEY